MRALAAILLACCGLIATAAAPARAQDLAAETIVTRPSDPPDRLTGAELALSEDDLLILEVLAGSFQLADSIPAYATQSGTFLPLGELARALDLAISADPARGRADGWILNENRRFRLDLAARTAESGEKTLAFAPGEVRAHKGDLYVRVELLQELLPAVLKVDSRAAILTVLPTERLPFRQRIERETRRAGLAAGPRPQRPVLSIQNPYTAFSAPAAAVNFAAEYGKDPRSRLEVRAAGDLAFAGYQLFAGGARAGRVDSVRLAFERVDPDGGGPIPGVRRLTFGDTVAPALAMGPRNALGRGFSLSTAPLETTSVFDTVDIHGELPAGWEVELYVGEVLRGSTSEAPDGRYEFNDLALAYGMNVVRLVYYGPKGEKREEVRRYNVAAGGLPKGQFELRLSAVEDRAPLIDLGRSYAGLREGFSPRIEEGGWQYVAEAAYGVGMGATLRAGLARTQRPERGAYSLGALALSVPLGGYAAQLALAADDQGGTGGVFGLAGHLLGGSFVLRHAEYHGGFLDEQARVLGGRQAARATSASVDAVLALPGRRAPARVQLDRSELLNGRVLYDLDARLSTPVSRLLFSASAGLHVSTGAGPQKTDGSASLSLSGPIAHDWRVRADVGFSESPGFAFSADRATIWGPFRIAYAQRFGRQPDSLIQVGQSWRLDSIDIGLFASYRTATDDARIGVSFSTGFAYDRFRGQYRRVGEAAATGGAVALHAFHDLDGDGAWSPDEPPVPNLPVTGGRRATATDADGRAVIAGLGVGTRSPVRVDTEVIEDPYVATPPPTIVTQSRPGRVAFAPFPIVSVGEFEVAVVLEQPEGDDKLISAVSIQLVDRNGAVAAERRTGFDGVAVFDRIPTGRYAMRVEPEQAQRLGLAFVETPIVEIPPAGGFVGQIDARLALGAQAPQIDLAALGGARAAATPAAGPAAFAPPPIAKAQLDNRRLRRVTARGPPAEREERGLVGEAIQRLGGLVRRLFGADPRPAVAAPRQTAAR